MDSLQPPITVLVPPQQNAEAEDIRENKDLAALSYVWILALVVHFSAHKSPFATFHCRQGLVLFALSFLITIPVVGLLLALIIAAFCITGFLNAAQGLKKDLLFIGPIARADLPDLRRHAGIAWQWLRSKASRKRKPAGLPPNPPPISHP